MLSRCVSRLAESVVAVGALIGANLAVEHLSRGADDRLLAVYRGDGRHPLLVGLLAFAAAHDPQVRVRA
jgi:hypothetical protein